MRPKRKFFDSQFAVPSRIPEDRFPISFSDCARTHARADAHTPNAHAHDQLIALLEIQDPEEPTPRRTARWAAPPAGLLRPPLYQRKMTRMVRF
jgi:hypothetical protein